MMKFKRFLCCCCCCSDGDYGKNKKMDHRASGYYDSDSEVSNVGIIEMNEENFQDILNRYKFLLVQFNDRK